MYTDKSLKKIQPSPFRDCIATKTPARGSRVPRPSCHSCVSAWSFPRISLEEEEDLDWLNAQKEEDVIACSCSFLFPLLKNIKLKNWLGLIKNIVTLY